jgi:putative oxidoreductase
MIEKLLHTDPDYAWTFLRIIAGLIIFPYGMQKRFKRFRGPGIDGTLKNLGARRIPRSIAWLIIVGQSFGSIALVAAC